MSTSGISADTNADGVVVNIIPKEAAILQNDPRGPFSNYSLESDNLRRAENRGLTRAPKR